MKTIVDIINENLTLNDQPSGIVLFEAYYIKKHGSLEAAQNHFLKLKQQCETDEQFQNMLIVQMETDFNFTKLKPLLDVFLKIENFSSFLNIEEDIKNCLMKLELSKQDLEKIIETKDLCGSLLIKHLHPEKEILKKLLIVKLADKITFTIKETREELGFKDQRTFKKWLNYFFPDKYNGRRIVNILDYINIWEKFLLTPEEHKIDIKNKSVEYRQRLDQGLVFSKERLKKLTADHYKALKNEIDSINKLEGLQLPNNVDKFPFSIVHIIKKHLT